MFEKVKRFFDSTSQSNLVHHPTWYKYFLSFILEKNSAHFISLLVATRRHFPSSQWQKKMFSGVSRPLSLAYLFPAQACVQYCCLNTSLGVQFSFRFFFFLCFHFRTGHLHVAAHVMCLRTLQTQNTSQTFFDGHFFRRSPTYFMIINQWRIKDFSDVTFPNNIPSDGQIFG